MPRPENDNELLRHDTGSWVTTDVDPPEEAARFHTLYPSLIGFVCAKIGGVEGVVDANTFREAPLPRKMQARKLLLEHSGLVSAYVDANPDDIRELDLGLVLDWKRFVRGRFIVERDLRQHTVFMTEGDPPRAFGVLGLHSEITDIIQQPLPAMVVRSSCRGRPIICDGLLGGFNVIFGPGVRRRFTETYKRAKASGIVTSLDPDWQPSPPKTATTPRTPAISRFLKRCRKYSRRFQTSVWSPAGGDRRGRRWRLWSVAA